MIVLNKQDNKKNANDGKEKEKSPVKYATRTNSAAYICRRESVNELKEKKNWKSITIKARQKDSVNKFKTLWNEREKKNGGKNLICKIVGARSEHQQ